MIVNAERQRVVNNSTINKVDTLIDHNQKSTATEARTYNFIRRAFVTSTSAAPSASSASSSWPTASTHTHWWSHSFCYCDVIDDAAALDVADGLLLAIDLSVHASCAAR